MSHWPATKAEPVSKAPIKLGWSLKREGDGSHRIIERHGWRDQVFADHDNGEIGPRALAKLAKETGLSPNDL